jgi:predicted dehydrogenase
MPVEEEDEETERKVGTVVSLSFVSFVSSWFIPMSDTLNIGIIGAGGIAQKLHLPDIAQTPGLRVVALSGRKEPRLRSLAERFDVPRFTTDPHTILSDDSIDAVVVATPHPLHVSAGLEALRAGKHVLMQKPLCGEMAEADAFARAVAASDRTVLCLPHFGDAAYRAREMVREGAIGTVSGAYCRASHGGPEVYYAEVRDGFGETGTDLWFFDASQASVGALFDMGVYAVAQLVALVGRVVRVFGRATTIAKPTALEDTATLLLELENGALGTAETGWCDPARTGGWRVHGTTGKLQSPGEGGAALTRWEPGSYTREDIPPIPHTVAVDGAGPGGMHAHWRDCIRAGRQPPLSHAWAARHVTEILLAGLESSRTGQAIEIRSSPEPEGSQ